MIADPNYQKKRELSSEFNREIEAVRFYDETIRKYNRFVYNFETGLRSTGEDRFMHKPN